MNKRDQRLIHRATIEVMRHIVKWSKAATRGDDFFGDIVRANNMSYAVRDLHQRVIDGQAEKAIELAKQISRTARSENPIHL